LIKYAISKLNSYLEYLQNEGDPEWEYLQGISESVRKKVTELLKTTPSSIAFVSNTSHGINLAIDSIDWREGDEVIIPGDSFPANIYPWLYTKYEIKVNLVEGDFFKNFKSHVTSKTRVIAFDWVNYFSGERIPVREITDFAKKRGILVLVDAIQGLGAVPFYPEEEGVDFLVAGTAKWLLGPQGLGILYVNRKIFDRLKPVSIGWLSAPWKDFSDFSHLPEPFNEIRRVECGTKNYAALSLFMGSLELILSYGIENIWNRIKGFVAFLYEELSEVGFEMLTPAEEERRAGIVTLRKKDMDMKILHARLKSNSIITSLRNNAIRISPHFYNTFEEIERLVKLLKD